MSGPFSWSPPGPVSAAFMHDRSEIAGMMGPIGGGKTTTILTRLLVTAAAQAPDADGVRRTRFAVIRDTYRSLRRTVIRSWHGRVPPTLGRWVEGGSNAPSTHELEFDLPDGTVMQTAFEFSAIGDNTDMEAFARGYELTGAYLNELDTLPRDLLIHLRGRVGRYPGRDDAAGRPGPTWKGILVDFNAPEPESDTYVDWIENGEKNGYRLFTQPGGRTSQAENRHHLPADYYDKQIAGQPHWWIRRMIDNVPAYSRTAGGIYHTEWDDARHVAEHAAIDAPLHLGFDQNLRGACVVLQRSPFGQVRALAELMCPDTGWGATRFGEELRSFLDRTFPGLKVAGAGCDPAGFARDSDGRTWAAIVGRAVGLPLRPAPSNAITSRHETVREALRRNVDGGAPGLVVHPRCSMLRRGFLGAYKWRTVKVDGREQLTNEPAKTRVADAHDALQYGLMTMGEWAHVMTGRSVAERMAGRARNADADYDPHAF